MSVRSPARAAEGGFTLLELIIAIGLLVLMLSFVYRILWNAVETRDLVTERLESPKVENAIFDQIARDFRYAYFQAGQLPADGGFWGRSKSLNGKDADVVNFITARTSRFAEAEDAKGGESPGDSPLTEVGYACRLSDVNGKWLELWRREDFFVDDDPTDGGKFSLVYDKVRSFSLRYYPLPNANEVESGLEEWDTKDRHKLPYAIILDMKYDVRDAKGDDAPQAMVTKILLLKPARSLDPDAVAGMTAAMGMR